jgi:hypothetical protein
MHYSVNNHLWGGRERRMVQFDCNLMQRHDYIVRHQFITAASMKMRDFWDIQQWSLVEIDGRFRGTYRFHDGGSKQVWNVGVKVKQSRYTPWRRLEERKYSSYSFTTSALDGDEWLASRPGRALPPGKGPPVSIGWNVCVLQRDYTLLYPRRLSSSRMSIDMDQN